MTTGRRDPPGEVPGAGDAASPPASKWAELAADLVLANEVLPGPSSIPGMDAMRVRYLRRRMARRFGAGVFSLATAAAVGTIAVMALAGRYDAGVSYVVDGAALVQADSVEAPAQEEGRAARRAVGLTRLRFSEGTEISLDAGTRLRVPARTPVGADLVLDRGRASFAVVHRPAAKWRVTAGPFAVDVTGTRFSLEWSADAQRLTLDLESGGVIVRGNAAGPGVAVGPGERLVASPVDGRVTVQRADQGQRDDASGALAAGPAPAVALASSPRAHAPTGVAAPPSTRFKVPRVAPLDLAIASPGGPRAGGRSSLDVQPPPVLTPTAPSLVMGGGGIFCTRERAALGFESNDGGASGVSVPPLYHMAFSGPRADGTHSWCGTRSQRLDVAFTEQGRRNFMGRLPNQSGQVVIRLPRLMDFTDKTVSLHMFIDGPADARVAAQLFVIHHGKWVNGPVVDHLVPRRWWTISHTFGAENPLTVGPPFPPAGTSRVTDCDRIALIVYSTGGPRTWSGAVYLDEVGWK
ncbi:MAG: FecR family protein [Pseudomonadota bacterium]